MADNRKIDNSKLEAAVEVFAKERTNENFVKVMELLEKAVLYVPAMMPENLDQETMNGMREGIRLPKDAKVIPVLLQKESGEHALPLFSSLKQVPKERRSPAILALPFFNCVAMAMANREKVQLVVLNPYTDNIILPPQILEVAMKRAQQIQSGAAQQSGAGAAQQSRTVKLTEKQFHQLANGMMAYTALPSFLFDKQKEGLEQLQREEGAFLVSLYAEIYPKEIKMPYGEDD